MKMENKPIIEVTLENELDLILAFKKARELAEISGLTFSGQTKFITAVSEICRNALVHAGGGKARFFISGDDHDYYIVAIVTDQGPGIKDVETILENIQRSASLKSGIYYCQKLSDIFEIKSPDEGGTFVRIGRRLPNNHPPINPLIISGWRKYFQESSPVSPYDELKNQNQHLLQTLNELKSQKKKTQDQLKEIKALNGQLENNYERIKNLSKEIERQNQLLKKRNEDLDDFAYVVSHDLKAPVANLQSLLNLLEQGYITDQKEITHLLGGQVRKIDLLIKSILNYSRTGYEKVEKKEVDLNVLIQEIVIDLRRPENFEIKVQPDFPTIVTEEIFISQILNNLLTNSVKYNDKPVGQIKIGFSTIDGERYYFVEDNGPGIPTAKRDEIFKMFTVLKETQGVDSTGIGLAIIKKIINERGGKIWVEEAESFKNGSRFCFTWPAETKVNV